MTCDGSKAPVSVMQLRAACCARGLSLCDNQRRSQYQVAYVFGISLIPSFEVRVTTVLALETATEACSIAVLNEAGVRQCHEVIPRGHSQRVFGMLEELVPGGDLAAAGIDRTQHVRLRIDNAFAKRGLRKRA